MSDQASPSELEARPQGRREWSGWLRSLMLPVGLVVAIVAALLYIDSGSKGAEDDGFGTIELPATRNATSEGPSASPGRAAPDFLLREIGGDTLRLSDLQGRPVVVNFWATWCSTCRAETPDLIELYERHQTDELVILGVNLREDEGAVASWVEDFGIPYPVAFDRTGEVASTWRIGGPNRGVPSTYFIDRSGIVRKVVFGYVTAELAAEGLSLILPTEEG